MPISSDFIKEWIAKEEEPKRKAVLELALSCFPLLSSATVIGLKQTQLTLEMLAGTSEQRTKASGLRMLIEREEDRARRIKG